MVDLNHIFVISLAVLAFISFCFFIVSIPILVQLFKTLTAAQCLLDTVNDFQPEVKKIKESISSVKNVVQKGTASINETSILIISSVHGILTGIKQYLTSYKMTESSYNGKASSGLDVIKK